MSLAIFCLLACFVDYVPPIGEINWGLGFCFCFCFVLFFNFQGTLFLKWVTTLNFWPVLPIYKLQILLGGSGSLFSSIWKLSKNLYKTNMKTVSIETQISVTQSPSLSCCSICANPAYKDSSKPAIMKLSDPLQSLNSSYPHNNSYKSGICLLLGVEAQAAGWLSIPLSQAQDTSRVLTSCSSPTGGKPWFWTSCIRYLSALTPHNRWSVRWNPLKVEAAALV